MCFWTIIYQQQLINSCCPCCFAKSSPSYDEIISPCPWFGLNIPIIWILKSSPDGDRDFKTHPLASGGNRTTTFPISAPGKSTNFPSSFVCFGWPEFPLFPDFPLFPTFPVRAGGGQETGLAFDSSGKVLRTLETSAWLETNSNQRRTFGKTLPDSMQPWNFYFKTVFKHLNIQKYNYISNIILRLKLPRNKNLFLSQ